MLKAGHGIAVGFIRALPCTKVRLQTPLCCVAVINTRAEYLCNRPGILARSRQRPRGGSGQPLRRRLRGGGRGQHISEGREWLPDLCQPPEALWLDRKKSSRSPGIHRCPHQSHKAMEDVFRAAAACYIVACYATNQPWSILAVQTKTGCAAQRMLALHINTLPASPKSFGLTSHRNKRTCDRLGLAVRDRSCGRALSTELLAAFAGAAQKASRTRCCASSRTNLRGLNTLEPDKSDSAQTAFPWGHWQQSKQAWSVEGVA